MNDDEHLQAVATDEEYIQAVVDEIRRKTDERDRREAWLVFKLGESAALRSAVARHILSRDPECVRVPMKGKVG